MRVLVTGGSGRVGTQVARHLAAKHDVTILDAVPPRHTDVAFVQADILDLDAMTASVKRFDAVAHLAAIPHPMSDPAEKVFRVNVMGTFNVLEACAQNGVHRFVFTSSDSTLGMVFGDRDRRPDYLPIDEAHPLRPEDPYGLSKLIGEETCRAYSRKHGMNVTILRPCYIWNRDDQMETYRRLVAQPEEWPNLLWSYIHVIDVARAFEMSLEADWPSGCEEFFITAADNGTRLPTHELISRFIPEVTDLRAPFEGREGLISTAKAGRMLGWHAEHTWEEII